MNLFEIDAAIEGLFDEETGEITDIEKLESLEMEWEKKITYIACKAKNAKADAEALKAEKMAMEKRQKAEERVVESCKRFLEKYLDGKTIKNEKCAISYRKSTSTKIAEDLDLNTLPEECKKITVSANRDAIKAALLLGEKIEGCSLEEKNNIQIK